MKTIPGYEFLGYETCQILCEIHPSIHPLHEGKTLLFHPLQWWVFTWTPDEIHPISGVIKVENDTLNILLSTYFHHTSGWNEGWFSYCGSPTEYPVECLISINEALKDDRTYAWLWGCSKLGSWVEVHQPFVQKQHFSLVAALSVDSGIFGSRIVEGSFHQSTFLEVLRDSVVSFNHY